MIQLIRNWLDLNENAPQTYPLAKTGWLIPGNSLARDIADCQPAVEERFQLRLALRKIEENNEDEGGNPLRAEKQIRESKKDIEMIGGQLAEECANILIPISAGGHGLLRHKLPDASEALPAATVDVVVPPYEIARSAPSAAQRRWGEEETKLFPALEAINAALGYALVDRGTILLDNPKAAPYLDPNSESDAASRLAQVLMVLSLDELDTADYQRGFRTLFHTTVSTTGKSSADLVQEIEKSLRSEPLWLTPADWLPWGADESEATTGEMDVYAIVPRKSRFARIQSELATPIFANVKNCHIIGLRHVSPQWVREELQEGSIKWLTSEIRSEEGPIFETWSSLCSDFGITKPVTEFDRFLSEHIEPKLTQP